MSRALELSKKFKNSGTEVSKVSKDKAPTNDRVDDVDNEKERLQESGWRCGVRRALYPVNSRFPPLNKFLLSCVCRWYRARDGCLPHRQEYQSVSCCLNNCYFPSKRQSVVRLLCVLCRAGSGK